MIFMEKKGLGLLIVAAFAYGYYRYTKMTPEEKRSLKEKGRKFVDENFNIGNLFFGKTNETSTNI